MKFVIEGGSQLEGEIEVMGSKNAAGAILASVLLTKEECEISNIPKVDDILNLISLLEEMGCEIKWIGDRAIKIRAGEKVSPEKIDFEKFSKSRVSVLLIGALLSRFKNFKISRPGGDRIGLRPITTHLQALSELGADIEEQGDFYYFKSKELTGEEIILSEFSVTATETLLMATCLAEGTTIIKTAALEPHVQDLIKMLSKMGAKIRISGPHAIEIIGVEKLNGTTHKIISDYIEAGTFIVIGALIAKKLLVKNINLEDLDLFLEVLQQTGVKFTKKENSVEVCQAKELKAVKAQALPYPGFPTDLLPLIVTLLTQAEGKSLIHDPLYENRLNYTQELRKMGADIEIVDPHRAFVFGKTPLKGVSIESWDIRAGASLIAAGLFAKGTTTIKNIEQVDRGYERIEERLQKVGARIKRVDG